MALTDDLKAFYELETDGSDSHSGALHLTANPGTLTHATGWVGNGVDLEASSSQYYSRADHADLSAGNIDFTICAWVNFESLPGGGSVIVAKADASDLEWGITTVNGTVLRFIVCSGSSGANLTNVTWSSGPSTATPYFIVCWHDSVLNQIAIQVNNGTPVTESYTAGSYDSGAPFHIGVGYLGDANYTDGLVDNVGFWKRLLTTEERTELYNSGSGRSYAYMSGGGADVTWLPQSTVVQGRALSAIAAGQIPTSTAQ
jgi:hypothetical protein